MKKCLAIGLLVRSFACFSNTGTAVGLVYDRGLGVGLDFNYHIQGLKNV
jgi:hypothetical protein